MSPPAPPSPRRSPHLPGPLAAHSRAEDIKHLEELKHLKAQLKKTHAITEKDVKKQGEMQAELGAMEQSLAGSIQQAEAAKAEAAKAEMEKSIKVPPPRFPSPLPPPPQAIPFPHIPILSALPFLI